jgi:hypothetical protein
MSEMRGVVLNKEAKRFLISYPLFLSFVIVIVFFALIYLFFVTSTNETKLSETSPIFNNIKIFSHLDKAEDILYTIRIRESLDRANIHRVYYKIDVPTDINQEQLSAVAQKIVKETIIHERCHGIRVDFGPFGNVDFAPYGDWSRAGEVDIDRYKNYGFKYVLSSFDASKLDV